MRDNRPSESELFYNTYKEEFKKLIMVPAVAMSKHNNELIPYEFTNRSIKFRRDEVELDKLLAKDLSSITMYCFEKNMDKSLLTSVAGGNLWDYYCMKKSFGGR